MTSYAFRVPEDAEISDSPLTRTATVLRYQRARVVAPLGAFAWMRQRIVFVRENNEFYRGALALETFPVSEANIASRIRHDFAKIDDCEGGSLFKRSQKEHFFTKNVC